MTITEPATAKRKTRGCMAFSGSPLGRFDMGALIYS
jgi:hypothetical protein